MKAKTWLYGMVMATLIAPVGSSSASTDNSVAYTLNPYTVTAQRTKRADLDTPSATTVLTQEQLKATGASTVFDALSFVTGITDFSYGPGGMDYGAMDSRVNIRGIERGTLILVNGAPINLNGKNSVSGLNLDEVEQVEVVRGAASTLYGAEAMGGVINITTKSADESKNIAKVYGGNHGKKGYDVTLSNEKVRINVSKDFAGRINQVSPVRLDRAYYNSLGKSDQLSLSANVQLDDRWNFNYMRSESNSQYEQTNTSDNWLIRKQKTPTYAYNDKRNNAVLTYDVNDVKGIIFYNDRLLYGQTKDYRKYKNYSFYDNDSNYTARKIGGDIQKTWHLRNNRDTFVGGFMVSRDTYEGTSKANKDVQAGRNTLAAYGSYSYKISPRWTTTIGARYQVINDPVKDQHVFMPQWQTLYALDSTTSIYTNIGKSFTMPALSDSMAKNKQGKYIAVSGKNLKPEEGWNYEIGLKKIYDKSSLRIALYHMKFDNLFAWAPDDTGKKTIRINGGEFKNTGIEVEYRQHINTKWQWGSGVSYSNPQQQDYVKGAWELAYPKIQANAFLTYTNNKWSGGTSINWLTKRLENRDGRTNPDLIRWNGYIEYEVTKDSKIRLDVENILNRHNVITNGSYEYWDYPRSYRITYTQSW
ncbi:TonB-dependent receptor [Veillonella magna]|uniref:TonB-dependent receptor n=1 Tax=Veillonella magna TaxID=464322 RepID=UPI002665F1D4|nr:TonB-dependent receptor [Veillonella magna]